MINFLSFEVYKEKIYMENHRYIPRVADLVRKWIEKETSYPLLVASCKTAATKYLTSSALARKDRAEDATRIVETVSEQNVLKLIHETIINCNNWATDYHSGVTLFSWEFRAGCASLNTLLIFYIIIACVKDILEQLKADKIEPPTGAILSICLKTNELVQNGELQGLCHEVCTSMNISGLMETQNIRTTPVQ